MSIATAIAPPKSVQIPPKPREPVSVDQRTNDHLDDLVSKIMSGLIGDRSLWPRDILEAYQRQRGPYTIENAETILQEEAVELYNGWLVQQDMTDIYERKVVSNIQDMLSISARMADFGQALPDQLECLMHDGTTAKPDASLISWKRIEEFTVSMGPNQRPILQGGPELVVEVRSPGNWRAQERRKRQVYFASRVQVVWDVDEENKEIWVYRADAPNRPTFFGEDDVIDCEPFLPGWHRRVVDIFAEQLSATAAIGEVAEKLFNDGKSEGIVEGRAVGIVEGRAEGAVNTLRGVLPMLVRIRFRVDVPADLPARLSHCNLTQLQTLQAAVEPSSDLAAWMALLPPAP